MLSKHFKELLHGFKSYTEVYPFIRENKIWSILWVSLLMNLILVAALIFVFQSVLLGLISVSTGYLSEHHNYMNWLPTWLLKVGIYLFSAFVLFYLYRYMSLVFLSPLFSFISEKVQKIIIGTEHPFTMKQLTKDIIRGVRIAFRNLFWELLLTFFFLMLSFTGVLSPIVPIAIYLISSYFYGFAMIDYRSESRGLNTKESVNLIKNHRGVATGVGLGFKLFLLIPVLGILFAPPFAIIAGALAMEKVDAVEL